MTATLHRPLRGSRISSFYPVKNLPSLASLDSAFQLQEYISLMIRLDVHDVDAIVSVPGKATGKEKEVVGDSGDDNKAEGDEKERKSEITVDEACWIYEQLRRLAQDLSHPLITMLQQECTRASCPEMKAGEWLYLCVAHGNDGAMEQCCAIDYILHTLDSATALLNSPRAFPSRLQIPQTSHRHFTSLARRLGRIFAHAYFHHREAFEQAEAESSLHARFLALTSKFDLVPAEFLVIPPRLTLNDGNDRRDIDVQPPRLLAAAVDPQSARDREQRQQGAAVQAGVWDRGNGSGSRSGSGGGSGGASGSGNERSKSTSPPELGTDSPRKLGRNRTDTMVFSDAFHAVEDLAKAEASSIGTERLSILERHEPIIVPQPDVSSPEEVCDAPSLIGLEPMPSPTETPDKSSSTLESSAGESSLSPGLIHLEPENTTPLLPEDHSIPLDISPSSSTVPPSFSAVEVARPGEGPEEQRDETSQETTVELSSIHSEPSMESGPEVDAVAPLADSPASEPDVPLNTVVIELAAPFENPVKEGIPTEATAPAADEKESEAASCALSENAGTVSPEPAPETETDADLPPTVDDTIALERIPDIETELEKAESTAESAPAETTSEEGEVAIDSKTGNADETET